MLRSSEACSSTTPCSQAARRVTIPIEFLLPWDDDEIDRESGLALFDAFASQEKTLHAFSGSHFRVPAERIDTRFFARLLGGSAQPAPESASTAADLQTGADSPVG